MVRRINKMAILHKLESTYGTDSSPAAADAIIGLNVTFTPIEGEEVSRDLVLPWMGHQGVMLAGTYARLEFDVEIAGSGAAGTPPKYGSLLQAAGLAETIDEDVEVVYSIVEEDVPSSSIYFLLDRVRHVLLGCQVNVALNFPPKGVPRFRVTVLGLLGTIADVGSMPEVTQTGWVAPIVVSKAHTTMTLHGWTSTAENLSIDLGNTLTPRHLIGDENILISNRQATGTAVVVGQSLATINWFQRAMNRTRGALLLVHGTTAGNIVEVAAPAVEIGRPTQGQTDNIVNYSLPLMLCPVEGMDELVITVR